MTDQAKTIWYPTPQDVVNRIEDTFTYHSPVGDQAQRYVLLREKAKEFAYLIVGLSPPGREQSLALTKLEEAVMHVNSAVAREK